MADYFPTRQTFAGGVELDRVFVGGQEAEFVFGQGTQLFPNLPVPIWGAMEGRMVLDDVARWYEVGFRTDAPLSGNAAAGYTDSGNYVRLELQQSEDLMSWAMGQFVPAPVPTVDNGDGTWTHWARATRPSEWRYVTLDETVTSNRYGKSIVGMELFTEAVTLPGFPYAMPADAARLQADLRAAGYAGATVSSSAAALSVTAINYYLAPDLTSRRDILQVTLSGGAVTAVALACIVCSRTKILSSLQTFLT